MSDNPFVFEIPAAALLAVEPHLNPKEISRPWAQAILVEARGPNACVVATDGKTLAAFRYDEKGETGPDNDLLLCADWRTIKKAGRLSLPGVHFRRSSDAGIWEACCFGKHDAVFHAREVDAQYPTWRNIVPARDPKAIERIGYDWKEYAPRFANFGKLSIEFFGDERAAVLRAFDEPNLLGLLMPLMLKHKHGFEAPVGVTGWAREKSKAPAAA